MSEIRISPTAQVLAMLALVAAIVAGIAAQLPELRRYLKVKEM
jgi:hypothetical protein